MKKLLLPLLLLIACTSATTKNNETKTMETANPAIAKSIYDFKVPSLDGGTIDFATFKGKKILVVNTASKCGYTPQYEGLEKLYEQYKDKLVIVAFPANNFGSQEPGTNTEIKAFCTKNYGVTFPIASKVSVNGTDIDPLFKWLVDVPNPDFIGPIKWNFEKFLFDENGNLIHRYRSRVNPLNEQLLNQLK